MRRHRDPDRPPTLGDLLFSVTHRLRRMSGQACEPLGLSPHQLRALHVLSRNEGTRNAALAERLRITPRSATEVVDGLEAQGWAVRGSDPNDRRAVSVQITDEGRRVLALADQAREALHEQWFSVLDAAEREQLILLLGKLDQPERAG